MYDIISALQVAESQVDYHEGKSGGHWTNIEKFASMLPGFAWVQGQPWCAVYVQFVLWFVGVDVPAGARSASCAAAAAAYQRAGRWTEYPVIGAQVFYGHNGGEHCGIVEKYDDTYITTMEGNTNSTGSAEGDGVYRKRRIRRNSYVFGYGIPYYRARGSSPDPHWNGRDLSVR